jgi:phosphoribosylformylglycinamidine synthase
MTAAPLHLTAFEGGNALSDFRAHALLDRLRAVEPSINGVVARYVHWVASAVPLAGSQHDKLSALLQYGESSPSAEGGDLIVVMPRLGTLSPWASKATEIARHCGLEIRRVERVTEYRLMRKGGFLSGPKALTVAQKQALSDLLHDRMTESTGETRDSSRRLFEDRPGVALAHVDVLSQGRASLERANHEFGLALSDDEIDYLLDAFAHRLKRNPTDVELMMFAQANTRSSTHASPSMARSSRCRCLP